MNNLFKVSLISMLMAGASSAVSLAQETSVINDTIYNPDIIYSPIPRSYEIAGINVEGINHVDD